MDQNPCLSKYPYVYITTTSLLNIQSKHRKENLNKKVSLHLFFMPIILTDNFCFWQAKIDQFGHQFFTILDHFGPLLTILDKHSFKIDGQLQNPNKDLDQYQIHLMMLSY